jgi:PleD family two-component response regulator
MKCPGCGYETEGWRKEICLRCGARLKVVCKECGQVNEGGNKFCQGCGVSLSEETLPEFPEKKEAKKILLIDNDKDILEIIKKFLEEDGYEIITASNGPEGLKKAREIKPDLITLDILMHLLDGFSVLEFLKKDEETKEIPVIVISCIPDTKAKDRALELGANSYIKKPFEREIIRQEVKKYLK